MSKSRTLILTVTVMLWFVSMTLAQDDISATATQIIIEATQTQAALDGHAVQGVDNSEALSAQSLQVTATPEPLPFDPINSDADNTTANGTVSASSQNIAATDNTATIILAFLGGVVVGGVGIFIASRVFSGGDKAKRG